MILMHLYLDVMFFKFLFIDKTFFCASLFLTIYVPLRNFTRENHRPEVEKILRIFIFVLFWNLIFMYKSMLTYVDSSLE